MKTRLERVKRMKKKGFTLIELLAVIVILAIIALIAVPVVMNIISKVNESAFKDSAYGILKAGENYYMGELLKAEGMTGDKVFDFSNDTSELEINGSKPTGGTMTVRKDGEISMAITNGKYCVTKDFEDDDVTITDDVENCMLLGDENDDSQTLSQLAVNDAIIKSVDGTNEETLLIPNCVINKTKCDVGTPVAIEVAPNVTYKFYVLSDDGKKVTLIMDRNLEGTVPWISAADYVDNTNCRYTACNDQGPLTALALLKTRTSEWTNIPVYTYTLKNDYDGQGGTYTYEDIIGELVTDVRARLPKHEDLITTEIGCSDSNCPLWLLGNLSRTGDSNMGGYWLSTTSTDESSDALYVDSNGIVYYQFVGACTNCVDNDSNNGLRPVITLSK